ncbi:MAG TPA: nucleotidyltransferase [Candidatus Dorea intestinavium]|nr:nucleotidyltransferase [Candidatus Dorea intestinavium]
MKKDCSLVIMAAGIGSRYKGGIKQLEAVGPEGELIIDYSINYALEAGFTQIVFVIRKAIEDVFKEVIGDRIEKKAKVSYVYQETNDLPSGFEQYGEKREKPWGTGQAILLCDRVVNEPFCIINADDYYGKEAFTKMYDYIQNEMTNKVDESALMGYRLENTLSPSGTVTRGVCEVDENNFLVELIETRNIQRKDGVITSENDGVSLTYKDETPVSMNMWAFNETYFKVLKEEFLVFLENLGEDAMKKEFLIPEVMDKLLKSNRMQVKVLKTKEKWYGITYKEDLAEVREHIKNL